MYYVYIIKSVKYSNKFYKGHTAKLKERIKSHNWGDSTYTKKYKPWGLEFYSGFSNKKKALDFEKYLKSASGIAFMRKRLID